MIKKFLLVCCFVTISTAGFSPGLGAPLSAQESDVEEDKRFEFETSEMGVKLKIVVYGQNKTIVTKAIENAVVEVQKVNEIFSDYTDDSEVSLLVDRFSKDPVHVSDEFWQLLVQAKLIHDSTDGCFDVTLGSLTKEWRRIRESKSMPEKAVLEKALSQSGFGNISLHEGRQAISFPEGIRFDFGGIAKGYAADKALLAIKQAGCSIAFVDLGGDIAIGDSPPGKTGWRISIAPLATDQKTVTRYIEVSNCGIATSGDTEQYVEIEGVRYSHVLDPRTGLGVQRRASVTVIANDAATADATASAYCVMTQIAVNLHSIASERSVCHMIQELNEGKVTENVSIYFPTIHKLDE